MSEFKVGDRVRFHCDDRVMPGWRGLTGVLVDVGTHHYSVKPDPNQDPPALFGNGGNPADTLELLPPPTPKEIATAYRRVVEILADDFDD